MKPGGRAAADRRHGSKQVGLVFSSVAGAGSV
jgi:hypothetical protein